MSAGHFSGVRSEAPTPRRASKHVSRLVSKRRRLTLSRQQCTDTIPWWCLRIGLVLLLTIGFVEIGSNIPAMWLLRKPAVAILESQRQAQQVLALNLHHEFGVDSTMANRIVRAAREAGATTQMPLTLLLAVIAVESEFKPAARNKGDLGLMQINLDYHPQEARELRSPDELNKIDTNVKIGARILRRYVDQEAGMVYPALRRYNGLGKTNHYPERVLKAKNRFDRLAYVGAFE
jgi:soluble lytic murein transglycosylase-like protein